jgi:hypothetical protein
MSQDSDEVGLMRPLLGILAAASLLFGATGAYASQSVDGLPGVTTGQAVGAPTPYGMPPNMAGTVTGMPLPSYGATPVTPGTSGYAANSSTSNIDLTPGSAGEPLYNPDGPLPNSITSDQTPGSSTNTTSSGM